MSPFDPQLWRLAGRIERRLTSVAIVPIPTLDPALWLSTCRLRQRRADLGRRHWPVARNHLTDQLTLVLTSLQEQLQLHKQALADERHLTIPSQRFLYEELLAIRDEFTDVVFDLKKSVISVTTDEIVLEDVEFGRFRIQLDIPDLAQGLNCYQVIALSPNRAACRDDTTHPHVVDNVLCEGEGTVPLQLALRSGRLSDFFLIVDRILRTYNPSSAYVSLDDWDDEETCGCCGARIPEYARYFCETCEHDTCEECATSCLSCANSACDSCIERCPDCDRHSCASCLTPCGHCQQPCCSHCQTDSLCEECHDPETNEGQTSTSTTPSTDTPVQPDRVGQAVVPA